MDIEPEIFECSSGGFHITSFNVNSYGEFSCIVNHVQNGSISQLFDKEKINL